MDYKSFVYQIYEDFELGITAKCIVHFRPHEEWDGTGYGFDWMRVGDTGKFGDMQPYTKIVGKQYHNAETMKGLRNVTTNDLVRNANEYKGTFKADYQVYQQLEEKYKILNMIAKPIKPPLAVPKYYCPWLSIFPKSLVESRNITGSTKATLRLYIEVIEEPDYLEFEENKFFTISQMKITEDLAVGKPRFWKNGATITIECNKPVDDRQGKINIFAYTKDKETGRTVKKLAGRLHVWENLPYRLKKAKILLVNVKTPVSTGNYATMGKDAVGKYLGQALISTVIEEYKSGVKMDISSNAEFRRSYTNIEAGFLILQPPSARLTLDQYLYGKLQEDLRRDGKPISKYRDYYILFFVGGKTDTDIAAYSCENRVVVFAKGQTDSNVNHELLHCFKLDHTFSNKIEEQSPNALYTYEVFKTENLMDYSQEEENKCFATWQWQWQIANNSINMEWR